MAQELIGEEPHDGDTTDGGAAGDASRTAPSSSGGGGGGSTTTQPVGWNSGRDGAPAPEAAAATGSLLLPDLAYGWPPPPRRPVVLRSSPMCARARERKRREKVNRNLIHLATAIPGLKKRDKAAILSAATRYVKELQEKIKAIEGSGGNERSVVESWDSSGTSSSPATNNPLPRIEAQLLNRDVMVRVHCAAGKGVAVRVLSELEELHLSIVHASVEPGFQACTRIMTITAKVDEGFIVTAEDIVGRLKSAVLMHQQSRCNSSEETA